MTDGIEDMYTKSIFEYRYLEGISTEDVAKKYGYTKGRVSQIVSNYTKKKLNDFVKVCGSFVLSENEKTHARA